MPSFLAKILTFYLDRDIKMLDIPGAEDKDGEAGPDDRKSAAHGWARDEC